MSESGLSEKFASLKGSLFIEPFQKFINLW